VIEGKPEERMFKRWSTGFKKLGSDQFESRSGLADGDEVCSKKTDSDHTHLVLVFFKLFYKKNRVDYPESV